MSVNVRMEMIAAEKVRCERKWENNPKSEVFMTTFLREVVHVLETDSELQRELTSHYYELICLTQTRQFVNLTRTNFLRKVMEGTTKAAGENDKIRELLETK